MKPKDKAIIDDKKYENTYPAKSLRNALTSTKKMPHRLRICLAHAASNFVIPEHILNTSGHKQYLYIIGTNPISVNIKQIYMSLRRKLIRNQFNKY